jgi:acyl dehydratase
VPTERRLLASRTFAMADQDWFGRLTGDVNPMHVDPIVARRTLSGSPAVHGVHLLLWLLDCLTRDDPNLPLIARIDARFSRFVAIGEEVSAVFLSANQDGLRAEVTFDGSPALQLKLKFGLARGASAVVVPHGALRLFTPVKPLRPTDEEMRAASGWLPVAVASDEILALFPHAARAVGVRRIAAFGRLSYLVGMVVPGLHSIFSGLAIDVCVDDERDRVEFVTRSVDPRFGMVRIEIGGGGIAGTLDAVIRPAPVAQAAIREIAPNVAPDAFSTARALVVGGSRGLGELTAKVIAAGGGDVIITYASGRDDAERVANEIRASGGRCEATHYDVKQEAMHRPAGLFNRVRSVYYFATPAIFTGARGVFAERRFGEFSRFYVSGFHDLIVSLLKDRSESLSAFYPSSVSIDERPAGMTEYTMAKAAGEILCADMNAQIKGVRIVVSRLPRLQTDQTASLIVSATPDPASVMFPIIRNVESAI